MKGGRPYFRRSKPHIGTSAGFTIVEVMIVLVVTGALFASIVLILSGRQATAQFNQAINNVKQEIEQIINEVQSGYPMPGNFSCSLSGGQPVITTLTTTEQGRNRDCVFLGKAVRFHATADNYTVYTIVGSRLGTDFATSYPTTHDVLRDEKFLGFGLRPQASSASGFTVTHSFGGGSHGVEIRSLPVPLSASQTVLVATISSAAFRSTAPNPVGGVRICLRSGTTTQSGLITVGGGSAPTSVQLDVKSTGDCT